MMRSYNTLLPSCAMTLYVVHESTLKSIIAKPCFLGKKASNRSLD